MRPSRDLKKYLAEHDIYIDEVYDARGVGRVIMQKEMHELGFRIAVNTKPCKNGHTVKTSAGKCVYCDKRSLNHFARYYSSGYVYVASSYILGFIKIGFTKNLSDREKTLRKISYGGVNDWVIKWSSFFELAGVVEANSHKILNKYRVDNCSYYDSSNTYTLSREIFSCSFEKAKSAVYKASKLYSEKDVLLKKTNKIAKIELVKCAYCLETYTSSSTHNCEGQKRVSEIKPDMPTKPFKITKITCQKCSKVFATTTSNDSQLCPACREPA